MSKLTAYVKSNPLGTCTMVLSLLFILYGLPTQVWKIWTTKTAEGVAPLTYALLALQSCSWVAYGIQKKDVVMTYPNLLTAIFAVIIVIQCIHYA